MTKDLAPSFPSGRGQSGGSAGSEWNDNPDRLTGLPPKRNKDQRGGPSMSPDVNASEIMQSMVMNDDDKKAYARLFKKQAERFLKPRNTVTNGFDVGLNCGLNPRFNLVLSDSLCLACSMALCRSHQVEGKKESELLMEPDDVDTKKKNMKKDHKKESNSAAAGGARGYDGSTGIEHHVLRKRKKNAKINARSFGGGQIMGKY